MKIGKFLPMALCLAALATAPASQGRAAPAQRKTPEVLPFIQDDYPRAVREAKARKVPIFVESWAPW